MRFLRLASTLLIAGLSLGSGPAAAQAISNAPPAVLAGSYRCMSYNVSGTGGSCAKFPRLVLDADGSYQYSSTRGRWETRNGALRLSASKLWGPGTVLDERTLRFQYDYRGWHHVLTWVCQGTCQAVSGSAGSAQEGSPGSGATGPGRSNGAAVGVSLTLQFAEAIGGVSGFVIVPAAAASGYHHNDPLPAGAVTGLAWESGTNTVKLATSRDNLLPAGRRYVVFLSWPRETIPVAVLDLPNGSAPFAGTISGTLDGARVLVRAGRP